jgi:hypothetical protein
VQRREHAEPRHLDHGFRAEAAGEFGGVSRKFDRGHRELDLGQQRRALPCLVPPAEIAPAALFRRDHGKLAAVPRDAGDPAALRAQPGERGDGGGKFGGDGVGRLGVWSHPGRALQPDHRVRVVERDGQRRFLVRVPGRQPVEHEAEPHQHVPQGGEVRAALRQERQVRWPQHGGGRLVQEYAARAGAGGAAAVPGGCGDIEVAAGKDRRLSVLVEQREDFGAGHQVSAGVSRNSFSIGLPSLGAGDGPSAAAPPGIWIQAVPR